jgi:hypothetical protein
MTSCSAQSSRPQPETVLYHVAFKTASCCFESSSVSHFSRNGGQLLFHAISKLYEQVPLIITTNLNFRQPRGPKVLFVQSGVNAFGNHPLRLIPCCSSVLRLGIGILPAFDTQDYPHFSGGCQSVYAR